MTPNHLTISRIFLALMYGVCLSYPTRTALAAAVFLTAAAFISDFLDGYWARKMNVVSKFGICFDPIADKIFTLCAFAMLMTAERLSLPAYPYLLIVIREVGISGVRVVLLSSESTLLPAERFGKWKAVFQFALVFLFTVTLWASSGGGLFARAFNWLTPSRASGMFWAVALYTFASSWIHLWRHRKALLAAWEARVVNREQ